MPKETPAPTLKGLRIPRPKGPATLILEPVRDIIWNTINCFWNPNILVKYLTADGVSTQTKEAQIIMSPLGWTATIDLTELVQGSSSGGRWFNGTGAPSSSTLAAGSYVSASTLPPDHYYDITNATAPDLWVCVTDGTESTSVWYNLSGCP